MFRSFWAATLSGTLAWMGGAGAYADVARRPSLRELVEKPYLELLEQASAQHFSPAEIEQFKTETT